MTELRGTALCFSFCDNLCVVFKSVTDIPPEHETILLLKGFVNGPSELLSFVARQLNGSHEIVESVSLVVIIGTSPELHNSLRNVSY